MSEKERKKDGPTCPTGGEGEGKLGVEEQDDEEVVITVQCTFYLKHPLLQISWCVRVCVRPPPVFSPRGKSTVRNPSQWPLQL